MIYFFTSVITTLLASSPSPRRPLATRRGPRCWWKGPASLTSLTRTRTTSTITTCRVCERNPLPPPSHSHPCPPCRSCDCSFLRHRSAVLQFNYQPFIQRPISTATAPAAAPQPAGEVLHWYQRIPLEGALVASPCHFPILRNCPPSRRGQ